MNTKELESIMVKNGVVLRAIPEKVTGIFEKVHIDQYPNGKICYLEEYQREMLVVDTIPENHGKFIFECVKNTGSTIRFSPVKYYDSIEQVVQALNKDLKNEQVKVAEHNGFCVNDKTYGSAHGTLLNMEDLDYFVQESGAILVYQSILYDWNGSSFIWFKDMQYDELTGENYFIEMG